MSIDNDLIHSKPYSLEVASVVTDGAYLFTTDRGVQYKITFCKYHLQPYKRTVDLSLRNMDDIESEYGETNNHEFYRIVATVIESIKDLINKYSTIKFIEFNGVHKRGEDESLVSKRSKAFFRSAERALKDDWNVKLQGNSINIHKDGYEFPITGFKAPLPVQFLSNLKTMSSDGSNIIDFNLISESFKIEGSCTKKEDTADYDQAQMWLMELIDLSKHYSFRLTQKNISLDLHFSQFDTSFSPALISVLKAWITLNKLGFGNEIRWFYAENNDAVLEAGKAVAKELEHPLSLIEKADGLYIEASENTPSIAVSCFRKKIEITGNSYPMNAQESYLPLMNWVKEKGESDLLDYTIIEIDLDHYNTSTSRLLVDLFDLLDHIYKKGKKLKIIWILPDEDCVEESEESISGQFEIPIELIDKESL